MEPVSLVTGAGGFLGGWLLQRLAARGAPVVAWMRDDRPTTIDLLGGGAEVVRVRGDVRDPSAWDRILVRYRPARVFHLAAESQVRRALAVPREAWTSNVLGVVEALEAVRRAGAPPVAVVVASSDKAYGPARRLPYDEDHPLEGRAPYDASKSAADLCARSYAATYGLPVVVTRAANLYGGGDLNTDRIVPEVCRALLEDRQVILRSDGSPERDYLHVEDAVEGYLALAEALAVGSIAPGEAFNLGTGISTPVRSVVEGIVRAAGHDPRGVRLGPPRPLGEIDRQALDASKARAVLGWKPSVTLQEGLSRTWAWYRDRAEPLARAWAAAG